MKKVMVILCGFLLTAGVAFAQKPYTGDWVVKSTGELLYKIYDNGKAIRMDVKNEQTGEIEPMILFGTDSLCVLIPSARGYGVFKGDALKKKKKEMFGIEYEGISNSEEYKYVKDEVISGLACKMYHYTQKETHLVTVGNQSNVKEGGQRYDVWISPEINHPVQQDDFRCEVMTNIKFGMPSASLFVIPKDYKRIDADALMSGFSNMMKSRINETTEAAEKLKGLENSTKKEGQTKEEQWQGIIDLFNQLENVKKK